MAYTENNFEFVDLGLPSGLLWATCNVGATSPEQAGLYFAWGHTTGYTAEQVVWREGIFTEGTYRARRIKQNLTLEQDAAHVNMGGKWRMPTKAEFQELIDNCTSAWTDDYNGTRDKGVVFTSKTNGNSVFFPAAGCCAGFSVEEVDLCCNYWSASWNDTGLAGFLNFDSERRGMYLGSRCLGFSVRGVCELEKDVPVKTDSNIIGDLMNTLSVLKDVSKEYSGRTIENIIVQIESRIKELKK